LGYSTASHFITAFKSKFGTTPKRYLNSNWEIKNGIH
jgi:AraC-like DNA-binding protein